MFAQLKVVDVGGLVQFTYDPQTDKKQIAALAPLVARAYEAGDEAAKAVVEKACRELALLVEPVARALHMEDGVLALTAAFCCGTKRCARVRRRCFGCDFRACGWRNPKATPPQAQRFWRWKH